MCICDWYVFIYLLYPYINWMSLPQILELPVQPGGLPAKLSTLHRFPVAPALPLHHHFLPARHAALWREIQLWRDPTQHLWQLPPVSAHSVSGNDAVNDPSLVWSGFYMIFFMIFVIFIPFISSSTDSNRWGLELRDVWWYHGIRWTVLSRHVGLHLLHHPLHLRKLYPAKTEPHRQKIADSSVVLMWRGLGVMSDLIHNPYLRHRSRREGYVCMGIHLWGQKLFAVGQWVCLPELFEVQCLSAVERSLTKFLSNLDCLQPTTLMIWWVSNILDFKPSEQISSWMSSWPSLWTIWQMLRAWHPPRKKKKRRRRGKSWPGKIERTRKTGRQLAEEKTKRLEGGGGEWEHQERAIAFSILDSQQCPEAFKYADAGTLKSKD